MTNAELRDAVNLLLQREEERGEREQKRADRRERKKAKEAAAGIARLGQSIEIIKWCVLSISTVMAISLVIGIVVIMEVEREAERIKGEVTAIQREAEMIREKIRHPLQTIGGTFGRRLEDAFSKAMGGDQSDK